MWRGSGFPTSLPAPRKEKCSGAVNRGPDGVRMTCGFVNPLKYSSNSDLRAAGDECITQVSSTCSCFRGASSPPPLKKGTRKAESPVLQALPPDVPFVGGLQVVPPGQQHRRGADGGDDEVQHLLQVHLTCRNTTLPVSGCSTADRA